MKTCFAIGLAFTAFTASAQEKPAALQGAEIQAPRMKLETTLSTNVLATPGQMPKEPVVKYSGFATDLKRSTNRWKFFSLRTPRDPKQDGANLVKDVRTAGGPGLKLFSVDF